MVMVVPFIAVTFPVTTGPILAPSVSPIFRILMFLKIFVSAPPLPAGFCFYCAATPPATTAETTISEPIDKMNAFLLSIGLVN